MFTFEDIRLSCGSALMQPSGDSAPTVSLSLKSGKKKAFGGIVRGILDPEGSGARWARPVSMACSLSSNPKSDKQRFEPRRCEITLRVEGAKHSRKKLAGTFDLAAHASYERSTVKVTVPLESGAGSLQLDLTSSWMKKVLNDGDDDSVSERTSDAGGDGGDSDESDTSNAVRAQISELAGVQEHDELDSDSSPISRGGHGHRASPSAARGGAHVPLAHVPPGGLAANGDGHSRIATASSTATPRSDTPPVASAPLVRSGSFGRLAQRVGGMASAVPGHRRTPSGSGGSVPAHRRTPSGGQMGHSASLARRGSVHPLLSAPTATDAHAKGSDVPSAGGNLRRSSSFGSAPTRTAALAAVGPQADEEELELPKGKLTRSKSLGGALGEAGSQSATADGGGGDSMFAVPLEAMEEVLRVDLPMALDALQEAFLSFDSEGTRFGNMLCRRLGYMQLSAGSWDGNEADGMRREVHMVVKCPPKPLLPDQTRVTIKHRLQRNPNGSLVLERELWTLDIPYGETFCVQERWVAKEDVAAAATTAAGSGGACTLSVHTHVYFKSKGLLATKIQKHALKKSRKCAAVASELLTDTSSGPASTSFDGGALAAPQGDALAALREQYESLLEEAAYYKNRASQLERENKRLTDLQKYARKSKKELSQKLVALEAELHKERRERAAMEEALTEAYSQTLRDIVAQQEVSAGQRRPLRQRPARMNLVPSL